LQIEFAKFPFTTRFKEVGTKADPVKVGWVVIGRSDFLKKPTFLIRAPWLLFYPPYEQNLRFESPAVVT
jgi:hypothetical protein